MKDFQERVRLSLSTLLLISLAVFGFMTTEAWAKEAGNLDQVRNGALDSPISPAKLGQW